VRQNLVIAFHAIIKIFIISITQGSLEKKRSPMAVFMIP